MFRLIPELKMNYSLAMVLLTPPPTYIFLKMARARIQDTGYRIQDKASHKRSVGNCMKSADICAEGDYVSSLILYLQSFANI
jgi:hypothetical protein